MTYKIIVEDMHCNNCARKISEALNKAGDVGVKVNLAKKEVVIDSDLAVEDIYAIIEDAGFTPTDCELM